MGPGVVVVVVVVVVGGAEAAACAGTTTAPIIGLVHRLGRLTTVTTPPTTIVFITCLRSYRLSCDAIRHLHANDRTRKSRHTVQMVQLGWRRLSGSERFDCSVYATHRNNS